MFSIIENIFMWLPTFQKKEGVTKKENEETETKEGGLVETTTEEKNLELMKIEVEDKKSKRDFVAKMFGSTVQGVVSVASIANLAQMVRMVLQFEETGLVTTLIGKTAIQSLFKKN